MSNEARGRGLRAITKLGLALAAVAAVYVVARGDIPWGSIVGFLLIFWAGARREDFE